MLTRSKKLTCSYPSQYCAMRSGVIRSSLESTNLSVA